MRLDETAHILSVGLREKMTKNLVLGHYKILSKRESQQKLLKSNQGSKCSGKSSRESALCRGKPSTVLKVVVSIKMKTVI